MKILVCGGRDFRDEKLVMRILDAIHQETPITAIIEGGARGADELAYAWARARGLHNQSYPADWRQHGRAAGPMRNRQMLRDGNPDMVVAFPGGRGTAHMVGLAKAAGIVVREVSPSLLENG